MGEIRLKISDKLHTAVKRQAESEHLRLPDFIEKVIRNYITAIKDIKEKNKEM
ncbi:MAG: hypothetical protein ABSF21_00260 [Dehalococcoidia bacterium]|jgi:predicted HicB family RNase H-like nuclease